MFRKHRIHGTGLTSPLLILWLAGCSGPDSSALDSEPYMPAFDGEAIRARVALLADDLYEGREAGKRGYQLAAKYVATQYRILGLQPGNEGSYFQPVQFQVARVVPGSRSLSVSTADSTQIYETFTDFTARPTLAGEEVSVTAPLVFVGYGVNIPAIERNDFQDVDLDGKIAVVVSGAPAALESEVRAFYRSGRYHKSIELEKRGAIGVISLQHKIISSEGAAVRGSKADKYWTIDEHDHPKYSFSGLEVEVNLLDQGARKLFENTPISFDEMVASIEEETYLPMELGVSASITHQISQRTTSSDNVIAILEGSDPDLKDEYVVLSAHLDGVGMGDESGDNIYNGYYDNASGIGTLLEVAKAFANSPQRPRRSIVFLATTGEEKGLLGSDYFAANPTILIDNIVANVNLDMVMLLWKMQDVVAFGAQHSTLLATAQRAADKAGVELSPDPFPERGYFTRSDQFPFVQQGVPAIFLATGFKSTEPGVDAEALYNNFMQDHYHGASDDEHLRFDVESAAKVALVNYMIAVEIANADERPRWQKDDFFGNQYGTDLTRSD